MKAKEVDRRFDSGEDITKYLERSGARRPGQAVKRVNVDFPEWMVRSLDKEARRLGVPRPVEADHSAISGYGVALAGLLEGVQEPALRDPHAGGIGVLDDGDGRGGV